MLKTFAGTLLALAGCGTEETAESSAMALDCAPEQVCPDGTRCPPDGVCPDPGDDWRDGCEALADLCAEEDAPEPAAEVCAAWLDDCFPAEDCDGDHEGDHGGAEECAEWARACWNDGVHPDREACGVWLERCVDVEPPLDTDVCRVIDRACALGYEDACWIRDEACEPRDGDVDRDALRDRVCGLLDQACAAGLEEVCDLRREIDCPAPDEGDGDHGDDGTEDQASECATLLDACTVQGDRESCVAYVERCVPPGEGAECEDQLARCAEGDAAACEDWLGSCAPESARTPECVEAARSCWDGEADGCSRLREACL